MAQFPSLSSTRANQVVIDAARRWRRGRDEGQSIIPYMYADLVRHDCGILAPVFDSLMQICEACLKRRMEMSVGDDCSADEYWLLALIADSNLADHAPENTNPAIAHVLAGALRSTRAMLALTLPGNA